MLNIRTENFRGFKDTGNIEIKPLTVLLGNNSAGKSSFLRIFPLFRQTLETKTSEPLLWYGDYVDFGSFNESLNRESKSENIIFEITSSHALDIEIPYLRYRDILCSEYKVRFSITNKRIGFIKLEFYDQIVVIEFSDQGEIRDISINNIRIDCSNLQWINRGYDIFPSIISKEIQKEDEFSYFASAYEDRYGLNYLYTTYKEVFNSGSNSLIDFYNSELLGNKQSVLSHLQKTLRNKKLKATVDNWTIDDPKFIKINNAWVYSKVPELINICNGMFEDIFTSVNYLKPVRANAQRYYRIQGLELEEINSTGDNIPMYLSKLSSQDKFDFESWTFTNFGFQIKSAENDGHVKLMICKDDTQINIADTGFGISQMLPIIVLLWKVSKSDGSKKTKYRNRRHKDVIVAIEQPELHLHPKMQATLMEIFVDIVVFANKSNNPINIIIETHSDSMINRLGELVSKRMIDSELISVLIFNNKNNTSNIDVTSYDDEGFLKDWPIGFFSDFGDINVNKI